MTKNEKIIALVAAGAVGYMLLKAHAAAAQPSSSSSSSGSVHAGLPTTFCGDPLNPEDVADYILTGGAPCSQ